MCARPSKLNSCVLCIVSFFVLIEIQHTDNSLAGGLNGKAIDHTHTHTRSLTHSRFSFFLQTDLPVL